MQAPPPPTHHSLKFEVPSIVLFYREGLKLGLARQEFRENCYFRMIEFHTFVFKFAKTEFIFPENVVKEQFCHYPTGILIVELSRVSFYTSNFQYIGINHKKHCQKILLA